MDLAITIRETTATVIQTVMAIQTATVVQTGETTEAAVTAEPATSQILAVELSHIVTVCGRAHCSGSYKGRQFVPM